jgi:phosphoglucosamine mutase
MEVLIECKKKASELVKGYKPLPQFSVSVKVNDKRAAMANGAVENIINDVSAKLVSGGGRLVVRQSGTEEVIRIMAESQSVKICKEACREVAEAFERFCG